MSRLMESDRKILRALMDHGHLSAAQLAREVEQHEGSIRRRLRSFLTPEKLVIDLDRARVCDPKLFALGPEGLEVVAQELSLPVSLLPVSAKKPRGYWSVLFEHRRLLADVRIEAHRAARSEGAPVVLRASLADAHLSSLGPRRSSRSRWDKFLLGWKVEDLLTPSEELGCIPDALLVLSVRERPELQMSCFVEVDRGTEHIVGGPIEKKLRSYFSYWVSQRFCQVPERPGLHPQGMRVLFVVEQTTQWRISAMRHALARFIALASSTLGEVVGLQSRPVREFAALFRFARASDVLDEDADFFRSPLWQTADGKALPLFRGSGVNAREEQSDERGEATWSGEMAGGHVCG